MDYWWTVWRCKVFLWSGLVVGFDLAANMDTNRLKKKITHPTNFLRKIWTHIFYCSAITLWVGLPNTLAFLCKLGLGISRFKTKITNIPASYDYSKKQSWSCSLPALEYGSPLTFQFGTWPMNIMTKLIPITRMPMVLVVCNQQCIVCSTKIGLLASSKYLE